MRRNLAERSFENAQALGWHATPFGELVGESSCIKSGISERTTLLGAKCRPTTDIIGGGAQRHFRARKARGVDGMVIGIDTPATYREFLFVDPRG
jgi:hypothetical protein